jgi:hypothetical protein
MRLAFLLLALAAILSWEALQLQSDSTVGSGAVVAVARRSSHLRVESSPIPSIGADQPQSSGPPVAQLGVVSLLRPAIAPTKAPAPPKSGEHFALVGVVANGGSLTAFLRDQVDGRNWTVGPRGKAGDWTVQQVGSRCVVLRRGRAKQRLCV